MLNDALTVFRQVLELFLMASAGYLAGKKGLFSETGVKDITTILFYIVTPALIVASMQDNIGKVTMGNFAEAGLLSAVGMAVSILLSGCFFRKEEPGRRRVLQFACAYSNCGFVGLPLAQAVLGSEGVMYASVFISVYNLAVWTHGLSLMRGQKRPEWKCAVLSPGVIGLAAGFPLFAASLRLPELVLAPLRGFSDLNTPLAMIVIGYYVSRVRLRSLFRSRELYALAAVRLLAIPAACLAALLPFHADRAVTASVLILAAAPSGANTTLFTAQFGGDVELSSGAVTLTTMFSLVTLPLFTGLAGLLL